MKNHANPHPESKLRYEIISYHNTREKEQQHLIYDTQHGPIGHPSEPSNVLACCWHKEQAQVIIDALNRTPAVEAPAKGAETQALLDEIHDLRWALHCCEDYRRAYREGKLKLYAMGGAICEAAAKHLPMSEGPLERGVRRLLKDWTPTPRAANPTQEGQK